jgi:hypothetical protein
VGVLGQLMATHSEEGKNIENRFIWVQYEKSWFKMLGRKSYSELVIDWGLALQLITYLVKKYILTWFDYVSEIFVSLKRFGCWQDYDWNFNLRESNGEKYRNIERKKQKKSRNCLEKGMVVTET